MMKNSKTTILFLLIFWFLLICILSMIYPLKICLIGFILALFPLTLWVSMSLKLDPIEKEPTELLLAVFTWGATGAVLLSLWLNVFLGNYFSNIFTTIPKSFLVGICIAPTIEEISKSLILFVLFFTLYDEFNGFIDYIIYSVFIGLGFACSENIMYYTKIFSDLGFDGLINMFILRGFGIAYIHSIFSSLVGIHLYVSTKIKKKLYKVFFIVLGLLTAISLHSLWNYMALSNALGFGLIFFIVYVPTIILAIIFIIYEIVKIRQFVRKNMTEFSKEHIEYLTSFLKRQKALWKELFNYGYNAMWTRKTYHALVFDLAIAREKSDPIKDEIEKEMIEMRSLIKGKING